MTTSAEPFIDSVPNEILGEIFMLGYQTSLRDRRWLTSNVIPFEILTSHVCRHWRDLAVSLPQLWASPRPVVKGSSNLTLPLYLKRSLSYPLDVECDFRASSLTRATHQHSNKILAILASIVVHVQRWRRLAIVCNTDTDAELITAALLDLEAPLLITFEFTVLHLPPSACITARQLFTKGTPSLTTFRNAGLSLSRCRPKELGSLTCLELCFLRNQRLTHAQLLSTLSGLPGLEYLTMASVTFGAWPPYRSSPPPINMPNLISLQVSDDDLVLWRYLTSIRARRLRSLTVHDLVESDFGQCSTIHSNFPFVEDLTIVDPHHSLRSLESAYACFPTISNLSILQGDPECLSALFEADTILPVGNHGWPQLQTITLAPAPHTVSPLLRYALGRIAAGYPLRRFILPLPHKIPDIADVIRHVDVERYPGASIEPYHVHALTE